MMDEEKIGKEFSHPRLKELDVEEIRRILEAVSEFLSNLKQPIKEMLDVMTSSLDGDRIGRDVVSFYSKLKESGVSEELASDMTREYLRRRLEVVPSIQDFLETATKHGPPWTKREKG